MTDRLAPMWSSGDEYKAEDGSVIRREVGDTPQGNPIAGRWVLRGANEEWVDFDRYRHDLMERNGYRPMYGYQKESQHAD